MFVNRVAIPFDAAHRLLGYQGKCASPHGHTFTAEVLIVGRDLDGLGLVIDFGDVTRPLKRWIEQHWDHAFLLNDADARLAEALQTVPEAKLYLFRDLNPSAEVMARELYGVARELLGSLVHSVRIWESPSQYAEYRPDESDGGVSGEGR